MRKEKYVSGIKKIKNNGKIARENCVKIESKVEESRGKNY